MKTYDLYLESGPKHMKTMVHVLALPGCVATGPTTEAALEAVPEAIRAYVRLVAGAGEKVDADASFQTKVVEHVTEGMWLGNGSPYITFEPDLAPVTSKEIEPLLARYHATREAMASWAESRTAKQLDSAKSGSRSARKILLHVMPGAGGYLSPVVGEAKGFSATQAAAERGDIAIHEALRRIDGMAADVVRRTTSEQRRTVIQRPSETRTLRKALRRMLEHDFEHLMELSRLADGPRV